MPHLEMTARIERWPIRGGFTISRGTKREAVVVVAEVAGGGVRGRGECTPYARYGETPESVLAQVLAAADVIAAGGARRGSSLREEVQALMPAGAARNALDCALWDYEAKRDGVRVADKLDLSLSPVLTAYTISLDTPDAMAEAARAAAARQLPLLKVKLGGGGEDRARIAAVRHAAPETRLIVDANEAWTAEDYPALASACLDAGVEAIEQPFPAEADDPLAHLPRPVPICADESAFTSADIARLAPLYDAVNIKLDKAGGLTEALALAQAAKQAGLSTMVGCMVATSLAMAPAMLLTAHARWVDLDGPLLLEQDRELGLAYRGAWVSPPSPSLWG